MLNDKFLLSFSTLQCRFEFTVRQSTWKNDPRLKRHLVSGNRYIGQPAEGIVIYNQCILTNLVMKGLEDSRDEGLLITMTSNSSGKPRNNYRIAWRISRNKQWKALRQIPNDCETKQCSQLLHGRQEFRDGIRSRNYAPWWCYDDELWRIREVNGGRRFPLLRANVRAHDEYITEI